MNALEQLMVFQHHSPETRFAKAEGWQFAPMHVIFDIKQEDLRHKARLVGGDHVIDSSHLSTCSSTIGNLAVGLLMLVAAHQRLGAMTGTLAMLSQ